MPHKVKRLPQARIDRVDIWLRIAVENLSAADKLADQIDDAVLRLSEYPESGPERPRLGDGIRICPVENWTIFYRLKPSVVEIVRILHAARDITPDMLSD